MAVVRNGQTYYPVVDGNGNITDYVDTNGTVVAHYEFDAFGNTITQSGTLADAFAYRFSTKYLDAETGLYYYGYRYYSPRLGRWVIRDPIGEEGGNNIYVVLGNESLNVVDLLGLQVKIPVSKKLCGEWIIRQGSVPVLADADQMWLGTSTSGFEVEYVPDPQCACIGDKKIIQSIQMPGAFSGVSPEFDMRNSNIKEQIKYGNILPLGYVEAGGLGGTHGDFSYRDAPYNRKRLVKLATAQKNKASDKTFTISVCAVCCTDGSYQNVGCANFKWLDISRKIVWPGAKTLKDSGDLSKASEIPGSTWNEALEWWNKLDVKVK
jgi:RHS repeat-associated protein